MKDILNIAGYLFTPLQDLDALKVSFLSFCHSQELKGTILLAEEGINLTLAGRSSEIHAFQSFLKEDARFAEMSFRESYSDFKPFKFLRVKLRKEIITLGRPEVRAELERGPSISPQEFKQWMDEGRDITILDTRNDFEVRFGTFEKAAQFHLNAFGEFPEVSDHLDKHKPIVMFCTGGIRCEKASLHLLKEGFDQVYQLDGGILNYFQEVGGDYYQGECFVFDHRVALGPDLASHGTQQCQICQGPFHPVRESAEEKPSTCPTCHL